MSSSKIRKIIVHCSDSPDSIDIGVAEIRAWHIGRGWRDIGYHYVIRQSGQTEVGRYENGDSVLEGFEIGAHVKGENSDSLAICWVGRSRMTREQYSSLTKLIAHLLKTHGLIPEQVYGHYEFDANKTCPNINMDILRQSVGKLLNALS